MLHTEIAPGVGFTDVPGEKFKRNLLVVHLIVPAIREKANEHALLPHVLERRCAAIPDPLALSRRLFDLYGADLAAESYMAGPNRVFSIAISSLKNAYALAGEDLEGQTAELLCNLLFAPVLEGEAFGQKDVEIEREKQMDYLRSELNDKRSYCLRKARRALLGQSPLGIESAGYLEEMPQVTPASLYTAYRELVETASAEVICCGGQGEKLAKLLAGRFAALRRTPLAPAPRQAAAKPPTFYSGSEAMDTAQGKLCILSASGLIQNTHGEAVMRVANALLGGLPTSRLFTNVREKQSLCYYCASSYAAQHGTLTMDSGIDHKNAQRAAEAMLHELEAMQKEPVSKEELAAAHSALQNVFSASKDSPEALVNWVFGEFLRGSRQSLDTAAQEVAAVTAEEVQKALCAFTPAVEYRITQKEGA